MATTDDRADSTQDKLDRLERLRDEAEHAGTEKAIERQREQGKLLARERLVELLDLLRLPCRARLLRLRHERRL